MHEHGNCKLLVCFHDDIKDRNSIVAVHLFRFMHSEEQENIY